MNDTPSNKNSKSWRGTWNRPVSVDENSYDPLTIARMTDHNVRGKDKPEVPEVDWTEDVTIEITYESREP